MEDNIKTTNETKNLDTLIESILFLKGEPVSIRELSKILEAGEDEVREALSFLDEKLSGRGICLVKKEDSVMLATAPESAKLARALVEEEFNSPLSKSSLETLAIVVYKGPVSRADIDYIRGVNSSFILRNLLVRGLVERVKNPRDSRAYFYKPTFSLLRHLGVSSVEELPEHGDFVEKMEEFTASAESGELSEGEKSEGEKTESEKEKTEDEKTEGGEAANGEKSEGGELAVDEKSEGGEINESGEAAGEEMAEVEEFADDKENENSENNNFSDLSGD